MPEEILLADDDDVGRYVVATMLRRAGFTVVETADGGEALAAAQRHRPDLAVLDVNMPVLDGFETCRQMRLSEDTRDIPVLLLSATFRHTEAQVEGLEIGADAYLTQPVEAPVLAATVRALLRSRAAEAEVRLAAKEWRATFDAISDAVGVFDADGRLLRANRVFAGLFGAVAGAALPELADVVSGDEIGRDGRLFSVRKDRVIEVDAAERVVVTLSDITAARAIETERAAALATERIISRTLQQSLLPERLPEHPRFEFHAWHAASESELIIGGDWYDVVDVQGDGLWLVMGDVAGHGVAAAGQAGQLRHSLRVYAHEGYGLVGTLERLNEIVLAQEPSEMATLCVVALDPEREQARIVRAGHPPPLLLRAGGGAEMVPSDTGVVLGIRGAHFTETTVPFSTGDRLVIYTDGLFERRNESLDVGLERLRRSAEGTEGLSALRTRLVDELTGTDDLRDDVALLLVRRR